MRLRIGPRRLRTALTSARECGERDESEQPAESGCVMGALAETRRKRGVRYERRASMT
jgi:hypothetical protein